MDCSPWCHKRVGHDLVTKQQHYNYLIPLLEMPFFNTRQTLWGMVIPENIVTPLVFDGFFWFYLFFYDIASTLEHWVFFKFSSCSSVCAQMFLILQVDISCMPSFNQRIVLFGTLLIDRKEILHLQRVLK